MDFDFEEVVQYAKDSSGPETGPAPSQQHVEFSAKMTPSEILQSSEEDGQRASPNDQSLDSFEYFDDALLSEAMQHDPKAFSHQPPSSELRMSSPQYLDDAFLDEDIQNVELLNRQIPSHKNRFMSSKYVGDCAPNQDIQQGNSGISHLSSYDEEYMDSLIDNAFFEESMAMGQDLGLSQLTPQPSVSLQEELVSQKVTHNAEEDDSHQAASHDISQEAEMPTSTEPVIEEGFEHSYAPSLPSAPAQEPDKESPVDLAFKEVMQYAYEHGLIKDFLLNSFSISHVFGKIVQSSIPTTDKDGFTDHSPLRDVEIPNPMVLDNNKTLTITPGALRLIAEARLVQSDEMIQSMTKEVCTTDKPEKLEDPILRTDNNRDVKAFYERSRNSPDALLMSIKKHRLPLYPQNIEEGEGMELCFKSRSETEMLKNKSDEEKLAMTKDLLTYLINQLKDEYTPEDQVGYIIEEIKYEKTSEPKKVTPPVSPKLKPKDCAPAFDPVLVPILSDDSSSLLSENFRAIENTMLGDHQDVWSAGTSPIREFLENAIAISDQDILLDFTRQTVEDMKVEVPLILDRPLPQPRPSAPNAFNEFIETEMDLNSEFEATIFHDVPDDNLEEKLQKQLQEATGKAMKLIEQEQLQAIDAIGRVPIPIMDFLIPEPEWVRLRGSKNGETVIFKWMKAGKEQLFKPPSWPLHRAAGGKMVWNPLGPKAGHVPENEDMHEGEPLLKKYLDSEVSKSLDFVYRRSKPACFEDDDRDEDIDLQLTRKRPTVDLPNVLRKRSMQNNAEGTPKRPRHASKQTSFDQEIQQVGSSLLPGDSPGVSGTLLANFMEVHAPKKRVWRQSKYFPSAQSDASSLPAPTQSFSRQDDMQALEQPKTGFKAPCPTIEPPDAALTVFISIRIPRRMIRVLEGLLPGLKLLERNYDAHNIFIWRPGSVVRTEIMPPLADDADLTVSPSTGLIVTSMIRVRQKPRTASNKSMIQTRVEKASLRYERLVVLVGGDGGKSDVVDTMSPSDSAALLELHGFVRGLECNVQVHYVGGGDKTLANWVAVCICRYGLTEPHVVADLLEPESLWEVFLRRAGFNVFAAQAVASQFKPPSNAMDIECSAQHGLGAFMTMIREERMRHFGQLVGPRVLERVSRNVDELWNRT